MSLCNICIVRYSFIRRHRNDIFPRNMDCCFGTTGNPYAQLEWAQVIREQGCSIRPWEIFYNMTQSNVLFNSIQFNTDICTRQLMNITLARTAKKKAIDNNKVHE